MRSLIRGISGGLDGRGEGGHIGENSRRRFEARKGLDEELKEGDLRINGLIELVAG